MLENTTLEQFSVLEEMSTATPVWRPFVHSNDTDTEHEPMLETCE